MRHDLPPRGHPGAAWFGAALPPAELSIELFPPKTPEAAARLERALPSFIAAGPSFISVTCGAGGVGEDGTFPLVQRVQGEFGVPGAAHLTCAFAPARDIDALAERYWQSGIRHIVALRGDPPKGSGRYVPRPDGFAYASDLIVALKRIGDFEISAACYPDVHPEAPSALADIDNLRRKVEAGATRLIGQYCFDTDRVLRFRDLLVAAGIEVEFSPGIMPIHSFAQVRRFSQMCGARVPGWLDQLFAGVDEASPMHGMLAASVASEQCRRLVGEGLSHLHIYALNRTELPLALVQMLGVARGAAAPTAAAA